MSNESREELADEMDCPAYSCEAGWVCKLPYPVRCLRPEIIRNSLEHRDCHECDYCKGRGWVPEPRHR